MNNRYSVALCTYNGSRYVIEQLDSIINQTIPPSQIVVSDDGSKDSTLDIVNNYLSNKDVKYTVCSNSYSRGVTNNFLNAIELCSEDIIFTSDQDDYWMVDKAEKLLAVYEGNPNALVVFSNGELVDINMKSLNCDIWRAVGITHERCNEGNWFHYLLKNCLITGATMSFRKNLLKDIDEIPSEWLHDGWLAWAAVIRGGLVPCPDRLIKYRQHGANVIGMKPVYSFWGKLKGWIKNFDDMPKQREIRYHRYLSLEKKWGGRLTKYQSEELLECINFWGELVGLSHQTKFIRLKKILSLYSSGSYNRFFVGTRGCLRDLILSIIK
jgi:Glycosyltransferases involved in cell wall biogenesis